MLVEFAGWRETTSIVVYLVKFMGHDRGRSDSHHVDRALR